METIAGTKHAIGFVADGGLEILVHVGLETVSLNGEGFEILVKEGDKVRKGQPVAKVDLDLIRERGLKTITSVAAQKIWSCIVQAELLKQVRHRF